MNFRFHQKIWRLLPDLIFKMLREFIILIVVCGTVSATGSSCKCPDYSAKLWKVGDVVWFLNTNYRCTYQHVSSTTLDPLYWVADDGWWLTRMHLMYSEGPLIHYVIFMLIGVVRYLWDSQSHKSHTAQTMMKTEFIPYSNYTSQDLWVSPGH